MINQTKNKKLRSSLSYQTIAAIILGIVCLAIIGTLIAVNIITAIKPWEIDGYTYYIRREKDENGNVYYRLTDKNKVTLEATPDGYYVAESGALIRFDPTTGSASKYATVDTEGTEQIGLNDRILIFPYTTRDEIQSIQVYNSNGSYAFYRLRTYEDIDKKTYVCYLHDGDYYLIAEDNTEYKRGEDGLYTLESGTKISIDSVTGKIATEQLTDFDGKIYTVRKNASGTYALFDGDKEIVDRISKTGTVSNEDGSTSEKTLYDYLVTSYGTLINVDSETGIVSAWAVSEYVEKTKTYHTYHFLYRNGTFVMCDGEGTLIEPSSYNDYGTKNNTYLSFNAENGSYTVRYRNDYRLIADNSGVYQLYIKGTPAATNSLGYCALNDGRYLYFDSASGSFSIMSFAGNDYVVEDKRYLNSKSYANLDGDFSISGFEKTEFDQSLFAALIVSSGYPLTAAGGRLDDPMRLDSGNIDFLQYGLAEGTRTDASGREYYHTPSYYVLTDLKGTVHRLTIGDRIISDAGYYIKYESFDGEKFTERQTVYILLDNYTTGYTANYDIFNYYTISDTLLAPLEKLITPMALKPMQENNFFDVSDFTIMTYNPKKSLENLLNDDPEDDDDYYDISVRFTYYNLQERNNTVNANFPYVMGVCELYGYIIDTDSVDECLRSLKELSFLGVKCLGVDDSDLLAYGLDIPNYIIYFKSTPSDALTETEQIISISAMTPNGTYYVYSEQYDMILEVDKTQLQFLSWKSTQWVSKDVYSHSVDYCDDFKLEAGDYWAYFDIDMSRILTTKFSTSASSDFTQTVKASDDRKYHLLTLSANLGSNVSSMSIASSDLISVDFTTLKNYYNYLLTNKKEGLTTKELTLLNEFIKTVSESTVSNDGMGISLHEMAFSHPSGIAYRIKVMFTYSPDGEITGAIQVNEETPHLVFSLSAYEKYEKLMFSEELSDADRREALDFYTRTNVSASVTSEYEQVTATNSEGLKTVYTNDKIVTTYADGTKKTDYCMTNDIKVFFQTNGNDLIGVGTRWVRYYPVDNKGSTASEYKEIHDEVYTFKATLASLVTVNNDGSTTAIPGGLPEGNYTVTVDSSAATVTDESGKVVMKYLRYAGTSVFSGVYSGLAWSTYEGVCDIPEEQKKAFREGDDSNCQVKITVNTKTGETLVFRTYQYSERRSYITVNGKGDFFILRSFIDKIIDTSRIVFDNVYVDPDSKYN